MSDADIKWCVFQRKDTKRWVLEYVPPGLAWDSASKQVSAPKDCKSEGAARTWAKTKLAQIRAAGGALPTSKKGMQTLREVHEQLMKVRAGLPDIKPATIKNNWTHLRKQILGLPPPKRAHSATPDAIRLRDRRAKLVEDKGMRTDKRKADRIGDMAMASVDVAEARAFVRRIRAVNSPNHTRNIFSTARALWDTAYAEGIISTQNPFRHPMVILEVPAAKNLHVLEGQLDPITLPLGVVQALLEAESAIVPLVRRVRYALAFGGGMDDGELAGLTWGSIKDGVPIVSGGLVARCPYFEIRQALALRGRDGFATVDTPKTENRNRDLPLHPAAIAALEEWKGAWEMLVRRKPKDTDFIFVRENGRPWRPSSAALLREDLRALNTIAHAKKRPLLIEPSKIDDITFKSSRRTFSSALKHANVEPEDRGRLMGHAGGSVTTRNYTAFELERLAELVARIPLRWPPRTDSLRRGSDPSGTGGSSTTSNVADDVMKSVEARIGFEPTYDGFAIGSGPLSARDFDTRCVDKSAGETPTTVGQTTPDGKTQGVCFSGRRGTESESAISRAAEGIYLLRATDALMESSVAIRTEEQARALMGTPGAAAFRAQAALGPPLLVQEETVPPDEDALEVEKPEPAVDHRDVKPPRKAEPRGIDEKKRSSGGGS